MSLRLRLPALERELDVRLSELDSPAIQKLIETAVEESQQLDFKTTWDKSEELAKDVCSFANAQGGLLIYGVRDDDGVAVEVTPFDRPKGELRASIAQRLRAHCRPVPTFEVTRFPLATRARCSFSWRFRPAPMHPTLR